MKQLYQHGGAAVIALVSIAILGLAIAGICLISYTSAYDYGNKMDNQLISIKANNKNIYAQGTQKVLEIAQVPGMYAEDFGNLIKKDIEGRYGKDGSKATMQWFKERNLTLDVNMYTKIQQVVEAFRNEFQNNQTRMIDVKRSYMTGQGSLWQGFWLRIAGFPKINMADYEAISTDRADEVFKAGKETGPLKLR